MIASSCSRMVGVGRSTTATFSGETRTTAFIVFGRDMVKVDFERLTVDSEASRNVGMQEPVNNCGHTRTSRGDHFPVGPVRKVGSSESFGEWSSERAIEWESGDRVLNERLSD